MPPQRTSILVAHPHALVLNGLCHTIREAGFLISDQTTTIDATLQAAFHHNPNVAIIDFRLVKEYPALIQRLNTETGATVAIVAVPDESKDAPEALKSGAKGYLSYSQTGEEFAKALSLLASGSVIVSNAASGLVQDSIHNGKTDDGMISSRERDVATLVARGATNQEIADSLMVSQHTVKIHLRSILNKLNLKNRQQIATYATMQGLAGDARPEDMAEHEHTVADR